MGSQPHARLSRVARQHYRDVVFKKWSDYSLHKALQRPPHPQIPAPVFSPTSHSSPPFQYAVMKLCAFPARFSNATRGCRVPICLLKDNNIRLSDNSSFGTQAIPPSAYRHSF